MGTRERLARDAGLTLVELAFVAGLFMVVLGIVGAVLWSAMRTTTGAQQESNALEEARLAVAQVERDIRGSTANVALPLLCDIPSAPAGYCLRLNIQRPSGATEFIRYRVDGTALYRDRDCASDFSSCSGLTEELTDALENRTMSPAQPAFDCDDADGSPEFFVRLVVGPLKTIGGEGGRVDVDTSVTPRNLRSC